MPPSSAPSNNVAYVEDQADDDTSSSVGGDANTRIYATTSHQDEDAARRTPSKEQMNTKKSRRGDYSTSSSESVSRSATRGKEDAGRAREAVSRRELRQQQVQRDQEAEDRRRRESDERKAKARAKAAKDSSKALKKSRPAPPRHAATQPVVQQHRQQQYDDPAHYGIRGPQHGIPQPASSMNRPRASSRPVSYHGGYPGAPPPPPQNWQHAPYPPSGPYPGPIPPGYGAPMGMPPPHSPNGPPPQVYYDPPPPRQGPPARDLKSRFDRPSSAMGNPHPSPRSYGSGYHEHENDMPYRKPSSSRTQKQMDDDRMRMPPPQMRGMRETPRRPSTTANATGPFGPPAPAPRRPESRQASRPPHVAGNRHSVGFVSDPFDDDGELFNVSPQPILPQRRQSVARPPSSRRESIYDDDEYDIMPAPGRRRRSSVYHSTNPLGAGGASLGEDNRYMDALRYQEDVGGPTTALTSDALRKADKRGGRVPSSRSTRSSASRDESDFKRSSATGITRSSSGENDFTIKVQGNAVVHFQGAEIACEDDTEITLSNGGRGYSDRGSTMQYIEDRPQRLQGLPHRTRAPSQSDSMSRGYIPAPTHAPYDPPLDYHPYNNFI